MATVWIPHPVDEDLSAALQWGEIKPVNDGYVYGDQYRESQGGLILPDAVITKCSAWSGEFIKQYDHLLIVGDHVQLMHMAAELTKRHGWFRVLRYDRKAKGYLSVLIFMRHEH